MGQHTQSKQAAKWKHGLERGDQQKVRLIGTHPAMDRRHMKMSSSCKHWVHHNLALPAGVVRIEKLRCRVSQEPGWGRGKTGTCDYRYPSRMYLHTSIYAMNWTQGAMRTTEWHLYPVPQRAINVHYKVKRRTGWTVPSSGPKPPPSRGQLCLVSSEHSWVCWQLAFPPRGGAGQSRLWRPERSRNSLQRQGELLLAQDGSMQLPWGCPCLISNLSPTVSNPEKLKVPLGEIPLWFVMRTLVRWR